ncbi:hypothetical protein GGR52DRAFT_552624 [Hypoxylon sp. FL1284]|nr:hypothetical protein GGR52DRAFT_552624 [Hypoxylon sp. FL1284]
MSLLAQQLRHHHLSTILALPPPLRLLLIRAPSRTRPSQKSLLSTSPRLYATWKYANVAAFHVPEFRATGLSEVPPEELHKTYSIPSVSAKTLEDELTALFLNNHPTFQYGESDFYKLKKNTRVPEVCVLGRSNVGKSSFINALANRHKNVLAYVSKQAGKTRAINTYGFGPPLSPKDIAAQAAEFKGKEDIPTHAFYLVDMPGYGYASMKEWGRNITLYLTKRTGVKGAIVLIDAEVGLKQTDLQLLELLCTAEKRTAIVLTKADKVGGGLEGLRKTCTELWDAILEIEKKQETNWPWEKEIFVTALGAKDNKVVRSTVTTGRLVVARLAGLVDDNRPQPEKNKRWTGKVVSFEDLMYTSSEETTKIPQNVTAAQTLDPSLTGTEKSENSRDVTSAFARLERASVGGAQQGRFRPRRRLLGSHRSGTLGRSHARTLHSSASRRDEDQKTHSQKLDKNELSVILDEFLKELESVSTPSVRARNARRKHDLRPAPPPKSEDDIARDRLDYARRLQQRSPHMTQRALAVRDQRLSFEARQAKMRERRKREEKEEHRMMAKNTRRGTDRDKHSLWEPEEESAEDNDIMSTALEEFEDELDDGFDEEFDESFVAPASSAREKKAGKKKGKKSKWASTVPNEPKEGSAEDDDSMSTAFKEFEESFVTPASSVRDKRGKKAGKKKKSKGASTVPDEPMDEFEAQFAKARRD